MVLSKGVTKPKQRFLKLELGPHCLSLGLVGSAREAGGEEKETYSIMTKAAIASTIGTALFLEEEGLATEEEGREERTNLGTTQGS